MNTVISDLLDTCVVVYLDNLIIFSNMAEERQKALNTVFAR